MKARFPSVCVALCAAAAVAACSDPNGLSARYETLQDTLEVFAMTGTPSQYPSALLTAAQQDADASGEPAVVRIGGSLPFDVAFDIDGDGNAVIYPLRKVVSELGTSRLVGLQRSTTSFESLLRAPAGGYQYDTAYVALPGEVVVVEAQQSPYCALDALTTIYSKLTVDSVSVPARTIYFRIGVDPNCGFRSFAPGVPGS